MVRERCQEDPEYRSKVMRQRRDRFLRYKYGISIEEYEAILFSQDGRCPACGQPLDADRRRLHVDHCHVFEAAGHMYVRGIIHGECNAALGLLLDDPARFRAAAAYLTKHRQRALQFDAEHAKDPVRYPVRG